MKASVILNPSESKRLIAKSIPELPVIKQALKEHKIVISLGTTNAYVAEELLDKKISKENFIAGFNDEQNNVNLSEKISSPIVIERGKAVDKSPGEIRDELEPEDVFLKGGNALDPEGIVGVMVGAKDGGTVGKNMGHVVSRGTNLVIPIGLEKTIEGSVPRISEEVGNEEFDRTMGSSVGLWPLYGTVITEIEAIELLTGTNSFQIAAGGVGSGRGSVTLGITGPEEKVDRSFELVEKIKGEPPLNPKGRYAK